MTIRVWGRLSSINVQKVMWTLDEIGLPYDHIPAGGDAGGLDSAAFLAMNPHGRIPVVEDGGAVVWESGAIIRYLCAAYSQGGLWPSAADERARSDPWMDWAQTTLQPGLLGFFWGWYRTPVPLRDEARNVELLRAAEAALHKLDEWLSTRAFITGDRLTLGDIPAGALLYRYFTLEIERPPMPALEAWYGRLCERPAYREQVMRPYDELRGKLAY